MQYFGEASYWLYFQIGQEVKKAIAIQVARKEKTPVFLRSSSVHRWINRAPLW